MLGIHCTDCGAHFESNVSSVRCDCCLFAFRNELQRRRERAARSNISVEKWIESETAKLAKEASHGNDRA